MKIIHLSDLHLGKKVNEFSMIEDQKYILTKIINIIDDEKPKVILIAGDIYDKSIPTAEAVELFDDFLVRLAKRQLDVFVISGNHDSPERIAFGGRLMNQSGIHMSPVYNGLCTAISLKDEFGIIDIYMLPFIKPAHVRRYYPDIKINSYTEAMHTVVDNMNINTANRNILITHQFVTGATRSDSEDISVGGSDNIDSDIFRDFDYVALGHIHKTQNIGSERIRYCGTPLKYSFSEAKDNKSVTVLELGQKGMISIRTVALIPKHDMREIKGSYMEITDKKKYENTITDDYLHITLTDEDDIIDAVAKLRTIYTNLMKLDYDNKRTRSNTQIDGAEINKNKRPIELFSEFYEQQNNMPVNIDQIKLLEEYIEKIWGEEV